MFILLKNIIKFTILIASLFLLYSYMTIITPIFWLIPIVPVQLLIASPFTFRSALLEKFCGQLTIKMLAFTSI